MKMLDEIKAREEVAQHMDKNEPGYRELLHKSAKCIDEAKKSLGEGFVYDVYGRAKRQGAGHDFKERAKISKKFMRERKRNPSFQVEHLPDIAGLTIVVYYHDQIEVVAAEVAKKFVSEGLKFASFEDETGVSVNRKVHREKGYHATHFRVVADAPKLHQLQLEVQIKTMLHDAWGAKMHDLTYKPAAELDAKLGTMMEGFGDSLQGIELQSELLRDAITVKVKTLRKWRKAARLQLMKRLESESVGDELQPKFHDCLKQIKGRSLEIETVSSDDPLIKELIESINALRADGGCFLVLKMTIFLASMREDTDLSRVVDAAFEKWRETETDKELLAYVRAASLHQTNRILDAVQYIKEIDQSGFTESMQAILAHNLASFTIEAALTVQEKERQRNRDEVEALLLDAIEKGAKKHVSPGAVESTKAAFLVVYGNTDELDDGISQCEKAKAMVSEEGRGYCELYQAYGWQRKLNA